MNLDLPPNLESTRSLLAGSLQLHATEQAPAVPADLLNDLVRRFNSAPVAAATIQPRTWFEAVQAFIARPAFGMAALAIVILGISVPRMIDSTSTASSGGFRGTVSPTAETRNIRIVLIQSPTGFQQSLARDIEGGMISSAASSESITGPRVLVDFVTSTITAVNAADEKVHTAPLPTDAEEISAAIATAVSRL
ncbi:MAG: hypothetical protein RLZZ214_1907 [Verrucomicrobiota bacterium]|jgi:hypothetical protein